MRIDILTLFPASVDAMMNVSILGRAQERGYITIKTHQIRDYTTNKQMQVDDYPYGGGCGMVLYAQPIADCLRAVQTGRRKLGGLGYVRTKSDGCIVRGRGRNVKANRAKAGGRIDGYLTIGCMHNALLTSRGVYNTLVAAL